MIELIKFMMSERGQNDLLFYQKELIDACKGSKTKIKRCKVLGQCNRLSYKFQKSMLINKISHNTHSPQGQNQRLSVPDETNRHDLCSHGGKNNEEIFGNVDGGHYDRRFGTCSICAGHKQ